MFSWFNCFIIKFRKKRNKQRVLRCDQCSLETLEKKSVILLFEVWRKFVLDKNITCNNSEIKAIAQGVLNQTAVNI